MHAIPPQDSAVDRSATPDDLWSKVLQDSGIHIN